ncbi:heme peroxidase [Mycena crocata]|nr:heme peroxidase [Mycena crocata]
MLAFTAVVFACLGTTAAYLWPSPKLDALEAMRFDQNGPANSRLAIIGFVDPCFQFAFGDSADSTGRANVPDWIRTAYHDMATHNITDGTGGLDASIRFAEEQGRPENPGDGFSNTIIALIGSSNRYISIADALALGTIVAVETCGGPEIPFRGGRVDAAEPNSPGVPEPQQDLQSHTNSFARQGFTPTEMISLIACGHSFGGVQHAPFPDIVPEMNDPNDTQSVAHFDSTFVQFDNNVATEYISGTTQNPLVVGLNDTKNSDKRIFGSDGNTTMLSFAKSQDLFASTCADLFARMLDTVPKSVQLTEVITPLPVKPSGVELTLNGDTLVLSGAVRFWNMTEDPDRTVRLLWDDHVGGNNNVSLPLLGTASAVGGRYPTAWYAFGLPNRKKTPPIVLNAAAGIMSMRFAVNGELEDQDGVGFVVQDAIVFSNSSCVTTRVPFAVKFDVAVRNGVNPTRVYLEEEIRDNVQRTTVVETDILKPEQPAMANSTYTIWSITVADVDAIYTIGAEIDGRKIIVPGDREVVNFVACSD